MQIFKFNSIKSRKSIECLWGRWNLDQSFDEGTFQLKWTDLFEQYGEGFVIRKFITHSAPTFLENLPPKHRQISTVNLFH
jgi:hypothetical protein